jgi:hypothetical protein
MKAIISHDIDHITVWEHLFRDTIIPKYMARMHIELLSGKITLREYTLRWSDFFKNKWQNIDELITFNNIYKIPSSFFIAVNKGVGLNYSNDAALLWIDQMKSRHCEIGIHGISYQTRQEIDLEFNEFRRLTQLSSAGIRMHYVRNTKDTFQLLNDSGYRYDSTEHAFKNPYKIGNMWEFPFQIMDGWVIENYKPWQSLNLSEAKENTIRLIDKARAANLDYLGIDFHDRYFSHSFATWLDWYMWLVDYLKSTGVSFQNFDQAITELELKQTPLHSK